MHGEKTALYTYKTEVTELKETRQTTMTHPNDHPCSDYIERLEKIRRLSTPSLKGIGDANRYSDLLRDNFTRIGRLSTENRAFLEQKLFPILFSSRPLSEAQTDALLLLSDELLSAADVENLDLPIMSLISDRLLHDAETGDDPAATIHRLDMRMDTCYALMVMMGRVHAYPHIADRFCREGLAIGQRFLEYLEPDRFRALDAHSREIVLTDARYMTVFYEGIPDDEVYRSRELELLDSMLALADDPFYRDLMPDFDWLFFRYRVLNYYAKAPGRRQPSGL